MILYVVRHGESESNLQGKWGGRYDTPLTPKGAEQARQLAEKLMDMDFGIIVASPLTRARQTAEAIREATHLPLVLSDGFIERNMGVFEGLTQDEIIARYPDLWNRRCTRQLDDAPTNGETYRQFHARITQALEKLKKDYSGKNVLLVTHFFVLRVIHWHVNHLSFEEMHDYSPVNCEIAEFCL